MYNVCCYTLFLRYTQNCTIYRYNYNLFLNKLKLTRQDLKKI